MYKLDCDKKKMGWEKWTWQGFKPEIMTGGENEAAKQESRIGLSHLLSTSKYRNTVIVTNLSAQKTVWLMNQTPEGDIKKANEWQCMEPLPPVWKTRMCAYIQYVYIDKGMCTLGVILRYNIYLKVKLQNMNNVLPVHDITTAIL